MQPVHKIHAIYLDLKRLRKVIIEDEHSLESELLIALPWAIRQLRYKLDDEERAYLDSITGNEWKEEKCNMNGDILTPIEEKRKLAKWPCVCTHEETVHPKGPPCCWPECECPEYKLSK